MVDILMQSDYIFVYANNCHNGDARGIFFCPHSDNLFQNGYLL